MKIGLFGGTFNPVHLGHLRAVEEVREYFYLIKLFLSLRSSTFKKYDLTEATHRLNMTKLAVQDNPYFEVSDFEVKQNKPSYTVNTVAYFKKVYEKDMLFL